MMLRKIVIFGATGSIGTSAINVIRQHRENFEIVGISANTNLEKLSEIAREFGVKNIGVADKKSLYGKENFFASDTKFFCGLDGLCELAELPSADSILMAIVGVSGLLPTVRAIARKKDILLASKEILVVAGKFVMEMAKKKSARILPVDSEHNAIFQCLQGHNPRFIDKLILTASGGPFRELPKSMLEEVTVEQALRHPTWRMGKKITIDSATLVNKGLEIIEARWLFGISGGKIEVVVHPESIIHSMVQFSDGSVLAQMCPPNMEFPIANCLFFPERRGYSGTSVDFCQQKSLTFFPIDSISFPSLLLARQCLGATTNASAVFQAADEIAVEKFLQGRIKFTHISELIAETLNVYHGEPMDSLDSCVASYEQGKITAKTVSKIFTKQHP